VLIEPVRCGDVVIQLARPEASDLAVLLEAAVEEAPYWAELWPSARALAEAVATRDVSGLRVLEVGSGLGLPALVAAAHGADVTASDVDPAGLAHILESARASDLTVAVAELDFAAPPPDVTGFDLVLAADVLYVDASAAHLAAALVQLLAPHGRALLTCPWRGQADRLAASLPPGIRVAERSTLPAISFRGQPMDIDLVELARS
jgi:predicted nicotinamide N-methyase